MIPITPEELLSGILYLSFSEDKAVTKIIKEQLKLIQQAKSEWLFEFISWYANKYEMKFTDEFKSGLVKMYDYEANKKSKL